MPSDPANALRPVAPDEQPSGALSEPKDRHRHRSAAYQYKFTEISATDQHQFVGYIDPSEHFPDVGESETREVVLEISEQLYTRVLELAATNLTARQNEFLEAFTSGNWETQWDLARILGVTQSDITRGLRPETPGLARALRRIAFKDPQCVALVARINELVESPIFSAKPRELTSWARYTNDTVRVKHALRKLAKRRFPDDPKAAKRYAKELWVLSR